MIFREKKIYLENKLGLRHFHADHRKCGVKMSKSQLVFKGNFFFL